MEGNKPKNKRTEGVAGGTLVRSESARRVLFVLFLLLCCMPFIAPPYALALGLFFALAVGNPVPQRSARATKVLLQISVVGLGFGMNLHAVVDAGSSGFVYAAVTIIGTLILGFGLGRLLRIRSNTSALISCGTAICGGSAIAAVGPVLDATSEEMGVSLGTVFVLNAVALFVFPIVGEFYGLSQGQFGLWAAIAIHDTSSVVGAAASYGIEALEIATTVKLTRALWIVPLVLFLSALQRGKRGMVKIPWFILLFVLASAIHTWLGGAISPDVFPMLVSIAKQGMTVTLFLIGAGLSRTVIRGLGLRPFLQGVALWLIVSILSLWAVVSF